MKAFLGAFGDPGHAFPMIALGRALRTHGCEVTIETAERWREDCEAEGLSFTPAPEYPTFPTRERPMKPFATIVMKVLQILIRVAGVGGLPTNRQHVFASEFHLRVHRGPSFLATCMGNVVDDGIGNLLPGAIDESIANTCFME